MTKKERLHQIPELNHQPNRYFRLEGKRQYNSHCSSVEFARFRLLFSVLTHTNCILYMKYCFKREKYDLTDHHPQFKGTNTHTHTQRRKKNVIRLILIPLTFLIQSTLNPSHSVGSVMIRFGPTIFMKKSKWLLSKVM